MKKWQIVAHLVALAAKSKGVELPPVEKKLRWSWRIHQSLGLDEPFFLPPKVWMEYMSLVFKIMGFTHPSMLPIFLNEWLYLIPENNVFKVHASGNVYLIDHLDGTGVLCVDGDEFRDEGNEFQALDNCVYEAFGLTIYLPTYADLDDAIHSFPVKISQ